MHRFSEKGKTAPHCSLQLFLWCPGEEKQVPKLERIAVKRWVDCEDIQRTDSEILLLAAAGSTIFKIFSRYVFTVYSSFDDNYFYFGHAFSPLGPPKHSCLLEWGAVLRFSENRCIKVLLLKNSLALQRQAVFLQSCRPLPQHLTSLHPFGGSKSVVFHWFFHYF